VILKKNEESQLQCDLKLQPAEQSVTAISAGPVFINSFFQATT